MENFRLMLNSTARILNSNRSKEDFQTMFLFCTEGVLLVSINIVLCGIAHVFPFSGCTAPLSVATFQMIVAICGAVGNISCIVTFSGILQNHKWMQRIFTVGDRPSDFSFLISSLFYVTYFKSLC